MAYQESIIKRPKKSRCIAEGDPDNHPLNRGFRSLIRSGEIYRLKRHNLLCYDPNHWHNLLCYDPNHNHWVWIPPPPSTMTGFKVIPGNMTLKRFDKLLAVGTDLVLVVLFRTQSSSTLCVVLKYSLLTRSWSYGTAMNSPRLSFGSASLGTKAIVAGGVSGGIYGGISNCPELYDSNMNKPRNNSSKLYIIGGESSLIDDDKLTCGEVYV